MSRKIHANIVHDSDRGDRHTERHYVCPRVPPPPVRVGKAQQRDRKQKRIKISTAAAGNSQEAVKSLWGPVSKEKGSQSCATICLFLHLKLAILCNE